MSGLSDKGTASVNASMKGRRVLVFGWGAAAEAVLEELAKYSTQQAGGSSSSSAIVCCLSHEQQAADCDLRVVCQRLGFECVLNDRNACLLEVAQRFQPDLIVSASYRKRIPASLLAVCADRINFHPSLLPKHKGCWSGFWCLFDGDAETGVTCHRMVEEFDQGNILLQERVVVAKDDTSFSIYKKLLPVTALCAQRVFHQYFQTGLPEGEEQQGEGSYHRRCLPFDGLIQPEWDDGQVERFIRAMYFPPFDGAAMMLSGHRVFVPSLEDYHRLQTGSNASSFKDEQLRLEVPSSNLVAQPVGQPFF